MQRRVRIGECAHCRTLAVRNTEEAPESKLFLSNKNAVRKPASGASFKSRLSRKKETWNWFLEDLNQLGNQLQSRKYTRNMAAWMIKIHSQCLLFLPPISNFEFSFTFFLRECVGESISTLEVHMYLALLLTLYDINDRHNNDNFDRRQHSCKIFFFISVSSNY